MLSFKNFSFLKLYICIDSKNAFFKPAPCFSHSIFIKTIEYWVKIPTVNTIKW